MVDRLRRLVWYERGAGFAEHGLAKGYPVALLRLHGGLTLLVGVLMLGFIGVAVTPLWSVLSSVLFSVLGAYAAPFPAVLMVVPLAIFGPRIRRMKRFMERDVVAARGLVCPRCLYDLQGAGGISGCPECGQVVDPEKLPRQWARTVRGLRYPDGDREALTEWRDV